MWCKQHWDITSGILPVTSYGTDYGNTDGNIPWLSLYFQITFVISYFSSYTLWSSLPRPSHILLHTSSNGPAIFLYVFLCHLPTRLLRIGYNIALRSLPESCFSHIGPRDWPLPPKCELSNTVFNRLRWKYVGTLSCIQNHENSGWKF